MIFKNRDKKDKKAEQLVDEMLEDAMDKVHQEEKPKQVSEKDLMALFDDCSDIELMLMGDEARESTAEAIDKLMNSDDFFDNLEECISALHALYIYEKVLKNRDIENKTIGEFKKEYSDFMKKWSGKNEKR